MFPSYTNSLSINTEFIIVSFQNKLSNVVTMCLQAQNARPIALRAISPLMSFSIPTPTKPPSPGPFGKSGGTAPARKASFCLWTYARFCGVFGMAGMYITACGKIRISDEKKELNWQTWRIILSRMLLLNAMDDVAVPEYHVARTYSRNGGHAFFQPHVGMACVR